MNVQTAKNWSGSGLLKDAGRHHLATAEGMLLSRIEADRLTLAGPEGAIAAAADISFKDGKLLVENVFIASDRLDEPNLLAALVDGALRMNPSAECAFLPTAQRLWPVSALATEMAPGEPNLAVVHRSTLRQLPLLWRRQASHAIYPYLATAIGPQDRLPPLRPPRPSGLMYERWVPELELTLSLRPIDRRRDLDLFHKWMNDGRVAFFWELAKSRGDLDRYLAEQESDPHIFGVIASFDEEPTGYFEFYWAKEDRLGPHYEPLDYDRGWHGLIGNPRHLGRPKTLAIFRSVTHYLFLDEPRTLRVVGEPRAAHQKMLSYCADVAYDKVKEFDFPHKRAMLVCCERERFFREVPL